MASLGGYAQLIFSRLPNIPGCTRPPHSAPGSPARNPPHRARSLAPTPGSPPSRPAAVALRARSVSASCAVGSARPGDTPDVLGPAVEDVAWEVGVSKHP